MHPTTQPTTQPGIQPNAFTKEQTDQMNFLAKEAVALITEEASADFIIEKAKDGDPIKAVAEIVTPLMQQLFTATKESGQPAQIEVLLAAGGLVVAAVAKLLVAEKVITEQEAPQFVAQVSVMAVTEHNKKAVAAGAKLPDQPGAQPPATPQPAGMIGAAA